MFKGATQTRVSPLAQGMVRSYFSVSACWPLWLCLVSVVLSSCGSIGPTADTKKRGNTVGLDVRCEPALVYECEELCRRGDLSACEQAGEAYFEGKHTSRDPEHARELSAQACEAGRARACGIMGKLAQDEQDEVETEKVVTLLAQGCEAGDHDACFRQALLLLSGKGVAPNPDQAHRLLQTACGKELPAACYELGVSLRTGRAGSERDLPRAAQLFTLACNKEVADACFHIGDMQWTGDGAARDALRAVQNLEKACELESAQGCYRLAQLHQAGRGITLDIERASKLFHQACLLKLDDACVSQGLLLREGADGVERNTKAALQLFATACDNGNAAGCVEQGRMLAEPSPGRSKDVAAAEKAFKTACDAGDSLGCGYLGLLLLQNGAKPSKPNQALQLLERGCRQGKLAAACIGLARQLASGKGGKKDLKGAYRVASDSCADNVAAGCTLLGELTEFGEGTERNPFAASKLYEKGCRLGDEAGCVEQAKLALQGIGEMTSKNAVTSLQTLCRKKLSAACIAEGRAYQLGQGLSRDRQKAHELFAAECRAGHQEACARQGYMHLTGRGAEQDAAKGSQLIRAACEAGDGVGCFYKTRLDGVSAKQKQQLLKTACEAHSSEACTELRR